MDQLLGGNRNIRCAGIRWMWTWMWMCRRRIELPDSDRKRDVGSFILLYRGCSLLNILVQGAINIAVALQTVALQMKFVDSMKVKSDPELHLTTDVLTKLHFEREIMIGWQCILLLNQINLYFPIISSLHGI